MKKLLILPGVMLVIVLLSGCGNKSEKSKEMQAPPASIKQDQNTSNKIDNANQSVTVNNQPGLTPDDEIMNIDNDLKSINDDVFSEDLLLDEEIKQ